MPSANFILKHWKKQQSIFLLNLKGLKEQDKEKTIDRVHDLRVATKKLRSYLKLLTLLLNKKDYTALFEKTEQLFNVLGKHRDIEMGLALINSLEKEYKISYTAFAHYLKSVHQQVWIWVQAALKNYEEKELVALTISVEQDLNDKNNDELLQKLNGIVEKDSIKGRRLAARLDQQAHLIRKLFKDLFYWASLLPKDMLPPERLKSMKKLLDQLGDWQDLEMLHGKVKHFRKDFVPDAREDHRLLKDLEKTILEKKQKLLQGAGESIHNALSH